MVADICESYGGHSLQLGPSMMGTFVIVWS